MHRKTFLKTGLLVLIIVGAFTAGWELYWRSKGFTPTYNDDETLWAAKRKAVYQPMDKATVFIGSSRIKFDLDIPTWRQLTGEDAVQLAIVGTSPLLLLKDLGEDENFKGKLVVDITEVLFFSKLPPLHQSAEEALAFYRDGSPSEKFSASISRTLESGFTFLEEKKFSFNKLLEGLELPNRPGVMAFPAFPKSFELNTSDRQTYMPPFFLNDTAAVNKITSIWQILILGSPLPPTDGEALQEILQQVKTAVDKIRNRGGRVIFVRTPSSGPMAEAEEKGYPRTKYWEQILAVTNAEGIHYADDEATRNFICPEWSHLSPEDAVSYTHTLAQKLFEKGWFNGYSMKPNNHLN